MNKLSRLLFRNIIPLSVLVLLGFFLSRGASALSDTETASAHFTDSATALVLPQTAYTIAHSPLHLPFKSKLKIEESEEIEDTKPKDTFNSVAKKSFENHRYQTSKRVAVDKSRLAYLQQSFYNRPTISLITLHHTWKIFLI